MSKEIKSIADYAKLISETNESLSLKESRFIIEQLLNQISADAKEGFDVRLHSFGTFRVTTRAARAERQGRNPSNGESLTIAAQPEKQVIAFKPSKANKV
jgi:nucleoid DNA-binding protein